MCPVQMKDPATAPYVISIWIQAFVMLNQFLWAIRIYRQKLNERKRVVFWASVGAMVTSLVYITVRSKFLFPSVGCSIVPFWRSQVWYGGSWEGRVIATCVITTVLISICSVLEPHPPLLDLLLVEEGILLPSLLPVEADN